MKQIHYIFIIVLLLATFSCKKNEPAELSLIEQMPPRTETGARKLACIVNDDYVFESNNLGFNSVSMYTSYVEDINGLLSLHANYHYYNQDFQVKKETIFIQLYLVYDVGEYDISSSTAYLKKKGIYYYQDPSEIGTLTVTKLDNENNIVAGTFKLNLKNNDLNETITITNGWFDINF